MSQLPTAPFRAISHVQRSGVLSTSAIQVDFAAEYWRVVRGNGDVFEHVDGQRLTPEGPIGQMPFSTNLPDLGMKLILAEPLSMWGRRGDDYRVLTTEASGSDTIITFVHLTDPLVRATALFDAASRRLVRLVRPTDATIVEFQE